MRNKISILGRAHRPHQVHRIVIRPELSSAFVSPDLDDILTRTVSGVVIVVTAQCSSEGGYC